MNAPATDPQTPVHWRRLHALGLPSGSVRAMLAVLIFGTTWGLLVLTPGREVPDYLRDLLFIIMGHYFAVRHRSDAGDDPGPPPLFLPRGSVRLILISGCVAVAVMLFRRGQLTAPEKNPGVVTLLLIGGFLLGVVLNAASSWWIGRHNRPPRIVEDLRALIAMAAACCLVALVWNRFLLAYPPDQIDAVLARWIRLGSYGPEHALAAVVGFYFGSKS